MSYCQSHGEGWIQGCPYCHGWTRPVSAPVEGKLTRDFIERCINSEVCASALSVDEIRQICSMALSTLAPQVGEGYVEKAEKLEAIVISEADGEPSAVIADLQRQLATEREKAKAWEDLGKAYMGGQKARRLLLSIPERQAAGAKIIAARTELKKRGLL